MIHARVFCLFHVYSMTSLDNSVGNKLFDDFSNDYWNVFDTWSWYVEYKMTTKGSHLSNLTKSGTGRFVTTSLAATKYRYIEPSFIQTFFSLSLSLLLYSLWKALWNCNSITPFENLFSFIIFYCWINLQQTLIHLDLVVWIMYRINCRFDSWINVYN